MARFTDPDLENRVVVIDDLTGFAQNTRVGGSQNDSDVHRGTLGIPLDYEPDAVGEPGPDRNAVRLRQKLKPLSGPSFAPTLDVSSRSIRTVLYSNIPNPVISMLFTASS